MNEQSYLFLKTVIGCVDGQVKRLAVYQLEAEKVIVTDVASLGN